MTDTFNPYESPKSENLDATWDGSYPLDRAGSGKRFLNHLIDLTLSIVGMIVFLVPVFLVLGDDADRFLDGWGSNLLFFGLYSLYYVVCETLWGQTIGKRITKTIVVNEEGGRPSLSQVIPRTISRFIPFEALSCLGNEPRGWHDRISNTYVVHKAKPLGASAITDVQPSAGW